MCFKMVMVTRHGSGPSFGIGSGSGVVLSEAELRELLASEILQAILEETPIMFGMIKEGVIDLMDERMRVLRLELVAG